jgi:predicted ABC-type ATPase
VSDSPAPHVIVVAGPNGAGKSTAAPRLLRDTLAVTEFVNADVIARGLSAFRPETVAVAAGRIMLARMRELGEAGKSFAFETTLASRSIASRLATLKHRGYRADLLFLWLKSADLAVQRVAERVRSGGHDVPEGVVRRRYDAGLRNLFAIYLPLADSWQVFDNSRVRGPRLLASGRGSRARFVADSALWRLIRETWHG